MSSVSFAPTRRNFLAISAASGAFGLMLLAIPVYAQTVPAADSKSSGISPLLAKPSAAADDEAIRPFRSNIPEESLVDLHRRIAATRWPDKETVTDASQGVQLATMQKLAQYWARDYDWRKCEAKLNALPQFVTNIDGLEIHFIHVRSKNPKALPIVITHGWPGSIIEQLKIIGPLTDPAAYGGRAEDSFDVVIPSLPGYGFSGKPTAPGWTPVTIAKAWATLMQRLGYTRYVAQGGDWGNAVSEVMALQQPPGLVGIHTNMAATVPANVSRALTFHEAPPPISRRRSATRGTNWTTSIRMGWPTPWRCPTARRHSMESPIRRWDLPHGCSITTSAVTR